MGRAPCCDKVGLKRGPWTPEEDQILISFIQRHGHANWRALPKQAGLLRCGKSCRLRWINYLKPDVKRGNFTKEEEDTIIQLHEMMGNRWSAIAARLPGRTDNEIKNVWHTHLKKRLNKQHQTPKPQARVTNRHRHNDDNNNNNNNNYNNNVTTSNSTSNGAPNSSQQSYSSDDFSSITDVSSVEETNNSASNATNTQMYEANDYEMDGIPIIDETFWSSEEITYDDIGMDFVFPDIIQDEKTSREFNNFSSMSSSMGNEQVNEVENVDFWLDVFDRAGWASELPIF